MSTILKLVRYCNNVVFVMLAFLFLVNVVRVSATNTDSYEGIVLPTEDDSFACMGFITIDGVIPEGFTGVISMELENLGTDEVTLVFPTFPYTDSLWLSEGTYAVRACLSSEHFAIQCPQEITVSRYEAVTLSLTVVPVELFSLQEKQNSFVPEPPVPYAQQQQIWNYLLEITGNAYAAAGLMGNLYAESGLIPTNLQDACEASLGYEDGTYTEAVDSGTYSDFASDWAGYGLAQWTWQERKQNLLEFARKAGASVGSLDLQLRFLAWELEEWGLMPELQAVHSVREASDLVLFRYEAPLNTGSETQIIRAGLSMTFYNRFAGLLSQGQKDLLEAATNPVAYSIPESNVGGLQWVMQVYEAAGVPFESACCAYHSGTKFGTSSDWNAIAPGAVIYGYRGEAGHAGIYLGNGMVCHCDGIICYTTLENWILEYQGYAWGWPGGTPA